VVSGDRALMPPADRPVGGPAFATPRRVAQTRHALRRIIVALAAGVFLGLFAGETAALLEPVADGFVKLLQMAVLPYVTVSIIGGIGGLHPRAIRRLGLRCGLILAGLWTVSLTFACLMPLMFPPARGASFFSTTLLEPPPSFSLVDLYIPANPFHALANGVVPAVVLFSIVVGVALIGLPGKGALLQLLDTVALALARVMGFVVRLTPYGVFAIAATTAGTIRLEQAMRLEVYLAAYGLFALLLALWVLPGLVAALTPIRPRELFAATREPLLTATVAGDLFIVVPVLIGACKELVARHHPDATHATALPDVIVPVSYNFPHSGKLLSVSFVLFAGWFSDAAVPVSEYPRLALTGVISLFGSINAAMPFLLDMFRVPADTFELFVASGVLNSRFGTLVAAMHTVAMALLGTCAATGALRWQPRAFVRYATVTVVMTISVIAGTRAVATRLLPDPASGGDALARMTLDERAQAVVLAHPRLPIGPAPPPGSRLSAIESRRLLRVGYLTDALPYAFADGEGNLIGLDVALMHRLALELNVRLELAPIDRRRIDHDVADLLRHGFCDVIVGGIAVTTVRAGAMQLSMPYLDETLGFVVADANRRDFESWGAINRAPAPAIAVADVPYYVDQLRMRVPHATLLPVASIEELLDRRHGQIDALAIPAERGSVWALRHPQFSVVVPLPNPVRIPLAFALPPAEPDLATFVNTWLDLKRRDGTVDDLYRYWILGRDREPPRPRWSIMRDVLHWVE
jgi:Na+/H+-dicarboxylate symporter